MQQHIQDFTIKYEQKLKKVTEPLKINFNIHSFWYFTISSQGEFGYVGNNPHLGEYYFSNQLYKDNPFFKKPGIYDPGVFYSRAIQQESYQNCLDLTSKNCNVDHNVILVEKTGTDYQGFGFATHSDFPMYQMYLNYLPFLKKYIRYFEKEAADILSELELGKVNIRNLIGNDFYQKPDCLNVLVPSQKLQNFYQEVLAMPVTLPSLTKREKECLKLSLRGLQATQIGELLSISPRTVECYLDNIKQKFHCHTKYELLSKIFHLNDLQGSLDFLM